ncbi:tetraspanin-3-like isoform X2 [Salvelinus namaycush]|uniref:Tetraspanin-3-like isoform X2 n=1 Tax=Salvelinus namaycush TaxID=8040 RepID=A0A8U0R2W4_SALNM|nr:tetraspanin-3-like isoform X2 [Salvelinus namaycush]
MGETRRRAVKIVIQITCQLLWLAGLVVGLSGMYLLLNYRHNGLFFAHTYIILPACLALASATLLLASGGLGIWVSLRKSALLQGVVSFCVYLRVSEYNKMYVFLLFIALMLCVLYSLGYSLSPYLLSWPFQFVYLLVMVFCLEATAAALAYVNAGKVDSELAPFSSVFQRYTGRSQDPYSDAVDATQKELQCCGIYDYRDWLATPWFNHSGRGSVPHSCCKSTYHTCNGTLELPGLLYPKGCQVKLEEALLFVLHLIIWSSLAVALVEVGTTRGHCGV